MTGSAGDTHSLAGIVSTPFLINPQRKFWYAMYDLAGPFRALEGRRDKACYLNLAVDTGMTPADSLGHG